MARTWLCLVATAVLASLIAVMTPAPGVTVPAGADRLDDASPAADSTAELANVVAIHDGTWTIEYAPGVDASAPGLAASIEAMNVAADQAAASTDGDVILDDPPGLIVPGTIRTDGAHLVPEPVGTLVSGAVWQWGINLDLSRGPLEIEVLWYSFGNRSIYGATRFLRAAEGDGTVLPAGVATPGPLANSLLGADISPDEPDIQIVLNRDLGAAKWHIGAGIQPDPDEVDMATLLLHQVTHGLGFVGSARSVDGQPQLDDPPFSFDTHVYARGARLLDASDPNALLTSGLLYFDLPDGRRHKLHDPPTWQEGSSYSHFDENLFTGTVGGTLMTPDLADGERTTQIDGAVLGAMLNIGWSRRVFPPPPPPPPPTQGTITGTVRSTDGVPFPDTYVNLFEAVTRHQRGAFVQNEFTDENGRYTHAGLADGCYILTFFPVPIDQTYVNRYVCVENGGTSTVDLAFYLGEGRIVGVVEDGSGQPFPSLKVNLFIALGDGTRGTFLGPQLTNGEGRFAYERLEAGCYVIVYIAPDGYQMVGGGRYLERRACVETDRTTTVATVNVRPG